ncbi:MAG: type IV toxin-antitoxin system AbiEi family antitoxin domain-containing protein [Longimicrobiales bacterium]|nr:type IV toxin-antitoxin system AbiEi family antitoxin domain-containing protein [Longimicrobiales bacterium]
MTGRISVPQAIQAIGRPVFTTREIAAVRGGSVSATSQALKRMERQGLLVSPARGIWSVPTDPRFTPLALVPYLAGGHQAYVSFFSALHLHGLIEQIPQVVYVATTGHPRIRRTPLGTYSFHRIHPRFFAGFDWYRGRQDFLIAGPEKALVDCLYLSSRRGRRFAHFPEIDFGGKFSFRRVAEWVEQIPYRNIRECASARLEALRRRSRERTSGLRRGDD